jgi:hypothetical protein
MWHELDDLISNDVNNGELVILSNAMFIAKEMTFRKVHHDGDVFKFEFEGVIENDTEAF